MSAQVLAPLRWLGARGQQVLETTVRVFALLYGALVVVPLYTRRRGLRVVWEVTLQQMRFTGVQALPLVSLAALALGFLALNQASTYLPVDYAPGVAGTILVREVVPLIVAMTLVGRSGTAIAVELGSMRVSGEVDALRALGMPLEHVVVLPRLAASVAASLALTAYALAVALVLGFALVDFLVDLPFTLRAVLLALQGKDVALSFAKAALFGAGVALVSVHEGLAVARSSREIPQAATRAAVRGVGLCVVMNSGLSLVA